MTRHGRFQSRDSSDDSDYAEYCLYDPGLTPVVGNQQPLTLIMAPEEEPYQRHHGHHRGSGAAGFLGMPGRNYMVLQASPGLGESSASGSLAGMGNPEKRTVSFTSLLKSAGEGGNFLKKIPDFLLHFLTSSQRILYFFFGILTVFFFFPMICTFLVLALCCMIVYGGFHNGNEPLTTRTIKWTITGFSQQLRDGFMASPPFLDKSGQWRLVVKQKKGMDGIQTTFGLMCTDIFPDMELITATASFFCTNQLGQEVNTGGMRTLQFQNEYHCPGDCGFSRPVRLSRRQLGEYDVITVNCTVQFQKETVPFLKALVRNLRNNIDDNGDGEDRRTTKKGKNVVTEHGSVFPGYLEFHDEDPSLSSTFRPVFRFVQHCETRTFVWEIPAFTSFLESSEIWGLYSPQFFVNSHDACSMWRMKLLEVQGIFRLHVQLRGLPHSVKQLKLWYLLHLVDAHGASIIPEHAVSRVKYPDHMKLWDTTRHILYRRETMLDRFIGEDGTLILRISLQIQPNDITLMEVDSDNWINCPSMRSIGNVVEQPVGQIGIGRPLGRGNGIMEGSPMLVN